MEMIAPDDWPEEFRIMFDESAALEIDEEEAQIDEDAVLDTPPGGQPDPQP